jgi:FtsP/CotA-like multicopper oxidase with cupredoxin domain
MVSRRTFVARTSVGGFGLFLWSHTGVSKLLAESIPGGTLDPMVIPKYAMPLVIPPAMPGTFGTSEDTYQIAVRQFQQQILPAGLPVTTVWSYGSINHPATFNYPAFTIEAKWNKPVQVQWRNELITADGDFLPHLLSVDQTLHWSNPPGGVAHRDSRPTFDATPGPYTGPVPIVTHLHGAAGVGDESDGFAEAWYLPDAGNIPDGFATVGTAYGYFKAKAEARFGVDWTRGTATFQYPNNHRASTLWYHDHTLGMTRVNVYAGPAGFYLLRGGPDDVAVDSRDGRPAVLPGPAPGVGADPFGTFYEIPIAVQDRAFNADGSLFYPDSRAFFDGFSGPYIPATDIPPIWNPEFFGNTIVVNGRTWPYLNVEQRRYRLRLLNGCNARFLVLKFDHMMVDVWQIGTEAGFLLGPLHINDLHVGGLGSVLLMGPAERADVIVDFSNVPIGTSFQLLNLGPDEPFGGFPTLRSDPHTTGQVMEFRVVAATSTDTTTPPEFLQLPAITPLDGGVARPLALLERPSAYFDGPAEALLGTFNYATRTPTERMWGDPITENPALGATEVWEFYNFTEDAHPIHIHEVQFQVVNRQRLNRRTNMPIGQPRPPEAWEEGFKDTVIAYPGQVTRVRAHFTVEGLFVWHCHIVEHEDNEMMRPYFIGPMP